MENYKKGDMVTYKRGVHVCAGKSRDGTEQGYRLTQILEKLSSAALLAHHWNEKDIANRIHDVMDEVEKKANR